MKNILVTGGAGYVGSHACLKLAEAGFNPVTYDNLSRGWADFVQWGPLEIGDIRDRVRLSEVFESYSPVAVVHFAALSEVGESTKSPSAYLDNNVGGHARSLMWRIGRGVPNLYFPRRVRCMARQ